jgi:ATP-dependent Clp protease ATP-binding subunit ClpB
VLRDVEKVKDVILFCDEMHQLVGAGATGGSMDASNMLKPALARGSLHFVGATTLNEYRKYVEKDGALARRFQPVYVKEPTIEDTISILRGLKQKYELHHRVHITDGAIISAAIMSQRYLTERKLPDKAVDLIDEAAARLRMQQESKPDHVYSLERSILTAKIELEALKNDHDKASVERRRVIEERIKGQEAEYRQLMEQWEAEKQKKAEYNTVKEQLETAQNKLQTAIREGDYNTAGQLKHVTIPQLQQRLQEQGAAEGSGGREEGAPAPLTLLGEAVTSEDVAAVVARHTGIPVSRLLIGERERLLHMEDRLKQRVVGQDKAVASISNCIRIARAGLHAHTKPMGCFLFLGPSGVGKTELAKSLAEFLFDDQNAMVRVDMSEYMERHSVSRLIGAPPGYVRQHNTHRPTRVDITT